MNTEQNSDKTEKALRIGSVVRSGFDFKKFNSDLNKVKKQFAKACTNYLNSKQHKAMIQAFKKVGAID